MLDLKVLSNGERLDGQGKQEARVKSELRLFSVLFEQEMIHIQNVLGLLEASQENPRPEMEAEIQWLWSAAPRRMEPDGAFKSMYLFFKRTAYSVQQRILQGRI